MKKITYDEAAYICRYKQAHLGQKYFSNIYLEKENENSGYINFYLKWWFYLLSFIPLHLVKIFMCLWNGGLKAFTFEPRKYSSYCTTGLTTDGPETQWGRFKEVYNKGA